MDDIWYILYMSWIKDTYIDMQLVAGVYFTHVCIRHIHEFEFQDKYITENMLSGQKNFVWKNKLICVLKYPGQLLFMNFCQPRQSCVTFSFKIAVYFTKNAFPNLIPYKFLHVYSPESCACGCKSVRQEIPQVAHLCILNLRYLCMYVLVCMAFWR